MTGLAFAPLGAFVVVGATVGLRLLLLGRRTRGLPELVLGAGLTGVCFVTLPALVLTVPLAVGPLAFQKALFAIGLVPLGLFVASFHLFTWSVFRRSSRVAGGLAIALALLSIGDVIGLVWARHAHWGGEVEPHIRPWSVGLMALFTAGFVWTGLESTGFWLKMRRRARLGLADPVVANRFLLWGLAALVAIACMAIVASAKASGVEVVVNPGTRLVMAAAGVVVSGCWYLAFVPPKRYLERLCRGVRASAVGRASE